MFVSLSFGMPNQTLLRRRAGHVIDDSERHFPPSSQSFALGHQSGALGSPGFEDLSALGFAPPRTHR